MLQRWQDEGGVMIIGYEMYRNLAQGRNVKSRKLKEIFNKSLVDPGKPKPCRSLLLGQVSKSCRGEDVLE